MGKAPSLDDFSAVFGTMSAADVTQVLDALDARRVPNYGRQLNAAGEVEPMPPAPEAAPDRCWEVMVPDRFHKKARGVIRRLKLEHPPESGPMDDGVESMARRSAGWGKWIMLVLLAAGAVRAVTRLF